jgi:hypothetical protein
LPLPLPLSLPFCLSFRSVAEESAVAFAVVLAVVLPFVCHSAAKRRNLLSFLQQPVQPKEHRYLDLIRTMPSKRRIGISPNQRNIPNWHKKPKKHLSSPRIA